MAHKKHISCRKTWLQTLAKRHTSSEALIFNNKHQLLILKPSYKQGWSLPGGVTDTFESPYQTVVRECKEEINLDVTIIDLVLIDYKIETIDDEKFDSIQFSFIVKATNIDQIKVDNEEILDYKFVDTETAEKHLTPANYNRLKAVLNAKNYPVLFEQKQSYNQPIVR